MIRDAPTILATTLCLALSSTPVLAQMDIGAPGIALGSSLMSADMVSSNLATPDRGRPSRRGAGARAVDAGLAPSFAPTSYRRAPGVTERVKRQYVDWIAKSSSEDGERVRKALAAADPVQTWSRYVAEDGMHAGDVADAMASYWVLNWLIVNGGDSRPGQVQAVRRHIKPTIASSPHFARLSEAQRQEMAEVFMVNFIFQRDTYLHAVQTHDEPLLARARAAAVARFQAEAGVDLRRLALTDDGFVKRGEAMRMIDPNDGADAGDVSGSQHDVDRHEHLDQVDRRCH